jgi:hypothetical protein
MEPNEKLKAHIDERSRIFAYACDEREWKSFTPIHRKDGFFNGSVSEIKRVLTLIDAELQTTDSEELRSLRRKILFITD